MSPPIQMNDHDHDPSPSPDQSPDQDLLDEVAPEVEARVNRIVDPSPDPNLEANPDPNPDPNPEANPGKNRIRSRAANHVRNLIANRDQNLPSATTRRRVDREVIQLNHAAEVTLREKTGSFLDTFSTSKGNHVCVKCLSPFNIFQHTSICVHVQTTTTLFLRERLLYLLACLLSHRQTTVQTNGS